MFSVYRDFKEFRPRAEVCIATYGWTAEHNLECFLHTLEDGGRCIFLETAEGYGLLVHVYDQKGEWVLFSEPLAPENVRSILISEFLEYAFSFGDTQTVWVELTEKTRNELLVRMPRAFRARKSVETLFWPTLNLQELDPLFSGPQFKSLRNAENRFLREHTMSVVDACTQSAASLHGVVDAWGKNRAGSDRAYRTHYQALIADGFAGTDIAQVLLVDGKAEAFFAGWSIPTSNGFYLGVALHSYAYWGLGEMLFLVGLRLAKEARYGFIDLGGSGEALLSFKEKFGTSAQYRTDRFSVARR